MSYREIGLSQINGRVKKPTIYLGISVIATLLDIGLLFICVEFVGIYYLTSTTISYTTALLTKFSLNKILVFQDRFGTWKSQLKRFSLVSINGLLITNILMYIGVRFLNKPYLISKIVIVFIVFLYTATLHNFVSFKNETDFEK